MNSSAKPKLLLSPQRRLIMTFALKQALEILQMPQQDLALWLKEEAQKNPLLEIESASEKPARFLLPENHEIPAPETLFDYLMKQVRENFDLPEQTTAEKILNHLDEKGFIETPLEQIARECQIPLPQIESVLQVLQTFDPPGICARNLQESLLLQLKNQGQEHSNLYRLLQTGYEDLLQQRFAKIKKKLKSDEVSPILLQLSRLKTRPADRFQQEPASLAIPDFCLEKNDGQWTLSLDESELPKLHLSPQYLSLEGENEGEKETLRLFKASAKWLLRSLNRRKKILLEIASLLIRKQIRYLDQTAPLAPVSFKELSEQLQIHESTLSRALAGKTIQTPRGCIPLRSLIATFPETQTAKQLLEASIRSENKQIPWTDDQLAQQLRKNGFPVARRTIAKYRKQLKLGTATQRKHSARD